MTTAALRYELTIDDLHAHLLAVQLTLDDAGEVDHLDALLPSWTPGSYLLREYARFIQEVSAVDAAGRTLEVRKVEKARWRIAVPAASKGGAITLRYRVYGYDLSVRAVHLNSEHAFINGPAAFMLLDGYHDHPCALHVKAHRPDWRIYTGLERTDGEGTPQGEAHFLAPDYTTFVDGPLELGLHDEHRFEAAGVPHRLVLQGPHRAPVERLVADLTRIVETAAAFFGGLPYSHYTFIVLHGDTIRGGLEHLNSTVLMFPLRGYHTAKGYEDFLSLAAHEHFHVWNVKRIRPAPLGPFDYSREAYTRALWLMEGATCYYENRILLYAGLMTPERYMELLAERQAALLAIPGRKLQSLEDSSFDAWIKLYRPDPANVNTTVSYYLKGEVAACLLDLTIRVRSKGARSLDDVMKALWARFLTAGDGMPEDAIQGLIEEAAGLDLEDLFATAIRGTDELPMAEALAPLGLLLAAKPSSGKPWLGIKPSYDGSLVNIDHVLTGGPAEAAGLCPGDTLVALDGARVTRENLSDLLESCQGAPDASLHIFRLGVLQELRLPLQEAPPTGWTLTPLDDADAGALTLRDAWLARA